MYSSVHINGITYTRKNLSAFPVTEEWQRDIVSFLEEFFDPGVHRITFQTSGTTGVPKKMEFTREQLIRSAEGTCAYFGLDVSQTALLCLPCKYVAGRLMLVRAIVSGMKLLAVAPSLKPLRDTDEPVQIDFAAMTPAQVYATIHDQPKKFAEISQVIIGGGEISSTLENELSVFSNKLYATYGMTETLTHVAVRKLGADNYTAVSPEIRFSVTEENCLIIRVPYLQEEELVTHDVVELEDEQHFRWLGRLDNIINSGGVKLYPEAMEQKIRNAGITGAHRFYITSAKHEKFGEVPLLVLETNAPVFVEKLLEAINTILGKYEQLHDVVFVDKINETATGKMVRERF